MHQELTIQIEKLVRDDIYDEDLVFSYDLPIDLSNEAGGNYKLVTSDELLDIDDSVKIVREYTSPWFSDAQKLKNGGTKSCKFPSTERNKAIFQNMHRADMNTNFPYKIKSSNNYVNGKEIWRNADVKVLSDFELQFTYGINRAKYLPLFSKKLNEIVPNGTTILESDWLIDWRKGNGTTDMAMFVTGKKYKYLNYVSTTLTQDVETINGVPQPPVVADEPYLSNQKEMTMHPFISFANILDLINKDSGANFDFTPLTSRLTNMGLILGGEDSSPKTFSYPNSNTFTNTYLNRQNILISSTFDTNGIILFNATLGTRGVGFLINQFTLSALPISLVISVNLKVTKVAGADTLVIKSYKNTDPVVVSILESIAPTSSDASFYYYNHNFTIDINSENIQDGYDLSIMTTTSCYLTGNIGYSYSVNKSYYTIYSSTIIGTSIPTTFKGRYDCLANLPKLTCIEFIQQMLIFTGLFTWYDSEGNIKFYSMDDFKANMLSGNVYDWTGRVSEVKKSLFQFNSNAQRNYIRYSDYKDHLNDDFFNNAILVDDETIASEKELYQIAFNLPNENTSGSNTIEFIEYEQVVKKTTTGKTFENKFTAKDTVTAYDDNGNATNAYITASSIMERNYTIYKKLINQPKVKDIYINLEFFESSNIKPEYPIWVGEWGVWCMYLGHTAPDNDVSLVTLLIINEKL